MNASSAIFCVSPLASLPWARHGPAASTTLVKAIRSTLGVFILVSLCDGGGLDAGAAADQLHHVPHGNVAAFDHEAVQRELALEPLVDALRDGFVTNLRVGIIGGHDT